jgi:cytoskeletal protein CcmA (bactofilin family)
MAQIIKHRRGSIAALKGTTARNAELIVASGSISDLSGPFVFIGSPNSGDEGVAGAFRSVSKIYQGTAAPTITAGTYGSILDGTPFYASGNESLYILNNDGSGGNSRIDLTGNIEGNLISGVSINNLTGSKATFNTFVSASALNVSGNTQMVGTLFVDGDTSINADLYITGNTIQTGSIDLTGNVKLGGNITVGDATTDFVAFGAEISSSIVPDVHNAFDLGSTDKNWRNLHVSGTAYVNALEAQTINLDSITVINDLTVSGSTYLGNGNDVVVVSGSIYNDQLTEKRLVVAGASGLLTNYSGLTFDNGNLNLSGALEVTNIQGTGSLYLKADEADSRYFEIYNTAASDTHIKSNGGLSFFGDDTNYLKIDDSLSAITINSISGLTINTSKTMVTGSIYNDQLTDNRVLVAGPDGLIGDSQYFTYDEVTLRAGAFEVDIMSGDIRTSGSLLVKSGTTITGSLNVTGSSNFVGPMDVKGDTTVTGSLKVTGSLDLTGSAQFSSTINVDGVATVSSSVVENLTQDRIVTVGSGGALIDSSGFTYNGTVFQIGGGNFEVDTLDGDMRTSGSLTVEGGQTINGDVTVNGVLTVTGNTQLQANLYVSGNLEVLGSATNVTIQSTTIELDDNIIRLNAYSPFERYAGFEVIDSGSTGVSASLVWDSLNDYWMFVSASGQSSKLIGTTAGTYGTENSLTSGTIPKATGLSTIGDSLLTDNGTTLSYNTNKFQVTASNGDTLIAGNVTLSYSGGTDNGSKTSAIVFKNSTNVLGYVSTTESTDVLDGILGYKNSDGTLKFSTVIDGGTY